MPRWRYGEAFAYGLAAMVGVAIILHLLMAHMTTTSKRLMGAMVLDRLDVELATTRLDVHNDVHGLGMPMGMPTDPRTLRKGSLESLVMVKGAFQPP